MRGWIRDGGRECDCNVYRRMYGSEAERLRHMREDQKQGTASLDCADEQRRHMLCHSNDYITVYPLSTDDIRPAQREQMTLPQCDDGRSRIREDQVDYEMTRGKGKDGCLAWHGMSMSMTGTLTVERNGVVEGLVRKRVESYVLFMWISTDGNENEYVCEVFEHHSTQCLCFPFFADEVYRKDGLLDLISKSKSRTTFPGHL